MLGFSANIDKIDVIEREADDYLDLINYIKQHDMSDSLVYHSISKRIDINNYIEYSVAQIFFDNTDWPGNNIKWWKSNMPGSRWRWLLYDTDFGFGLMYEFGIEWGELFYRNNTLDIATAENGPEWPNPPHSTFLLRNLLKNRDFQNSFINTFCDHLNSTFLTERVNQVIEEFKVLYEPEIPRHYKLISRDIEKWYRGISILSEFADKRPDYMYTHLKEEFELSQQKTCVLDVSDTIMGRIQINSILCSSYPWEGKYFPSVPVTITAKPFPNHQFVKWSDGNTSPKRKIDPNDFSEISAIFEYAEHKQQDVIINEINYISDKAFDFKDWVEFYNNSDVTIDLSNWIFTDGDSDNQFVFPANCCIQPNGYLVLSHDMMRLKWFYSGIKNLVGDIDFKFSSSGETLYLYNANKELMDMVSYGTVAPWPNLTGNKQNTIEFIKPSLNNTIAENWKMSLTAGGTPGAVNSTNGITSAIERPFAATALKQNYPNPFSTSTTINYEVNEYSPISIRLFDLNGRIIKTLVNKNQDQGKYTCVWNGKNDAGDEVTGNIYFCRMISAGKSETIKLIKQ